MPHRRRTPDSLTPIEQSYLENLRRGPGPGPEGPPGSGVELAAGGKKFVGLGLLLLAWRITPDAGADGAAWILPGMFYLFGAIGLFSGIRETDDWELNPFAGRHIFVGLLRFVWLWLWALAWVAIIAGFVWYGSPHLRISYAYSSIAWDCDYFGLNGWEEQHYGPEGCPLIAFIPLR